MSPQALGLPQWTLNNMVQASQAQPSTKKWPPPLAGGLSPQRQQAAQAHQGSQMRAPRTSSIDDVSSTKMPLNEDPYCAQVLKPLSCLNASSEVANAVSRELTQLKAEDALPQEMCQMASLTTDLKDLSSKGPHTSLMLKRLKRAPKITNFVDSHLS